MIIVIDTNILVSGLMSPAGNEGKILTLFNHNQFNIATTPQIIDEYQRVLHYSHIQKYLSWSSQKIDHYLQLFVTATTSFPGQVTVHKIKADPDDDKFLACALEAQANYILSGDQHLLKIKQFKKILIVTAAQFLQRQNQT